MKTMQKKGVLTVEQIIWIVLILIATFVIIGWVMSASGSGENLLSRMFN